MNNAALSIIRRVKPYGANSRLIDDGARRRYIFSIWYDGAYIINGKAGERRYIGYTLKEATREYNRLCRAAMLAFGEDRHHSPRKNRSGRARTARQPAR